MARVKSGIVVLLARSFWTWKTGVATLEGLCCHCYVKRAVSALSLVGSRIESSST